jgi:hypothetical protein
VIVAGNVWIVAAIYLMGRGKSIGEESLGLWAFCYGLPLPLTAWGIYRIRQFGSQPSRLPWTDCLLLAASLLAAAYPAFLVLLILAVSK